MEIRKNKMNKPYTFAFRVTPPEYGAVILMSEREGMTTADFLRLLIREGVKSRGLNQIGLIELEGLQEIIDNEKKA
jgi:hypothetical protein